MIFADKILVKNVHIEKTFLLYLRVLTILIFLI